MWTTYGSWLSDDERGLVEKLGHFGEPDARCEQAPRGRMTEPELTLDAEQRAIVEKTIADHCRIRDCHRAVTSLRVPIRPNSEQNTLALLHNLLVRNELRNRSHKQTINDLVRIMSGFSFDDRSP